MTKFNVDDLIKQGLVKKKTYTDGPYKGLSVLKYTRKVFFDNLWSVDDRLLECRGIVVDEEDNIIVMPFKKAFNYFENGAGKDLPKDHQIEIVKKVNGFMAAATMTEKYGLIISTTGTLDSDYAAMARKWIEKGNTNTMSQTTTYLFEICDANDPHVVYEKEGAYLIGMRSIYSGNLAPEGLLNLVSEFKGYLRPSEHTDTTIEELGNLLGMCDHEGYMVRDLWTREVLFKCKSPHYLAKKALQRVGKSKVERMWNNPDQFKGQLDEEFYEVFDKILDTFTKEEYLSMQEQERRKWIEAYFDNNGGF